MQISKRDIRLLIGLACFLILAASYYFGFQHFKEKREAVEENIESLQASYDELAAKNVNREKYIEETEENQKETETILSQYPSEMTTENEFYFTELLEEKSKASIHQLAYTEPESCYEDKEVTGITAYKSVSTLSFEATDKTFKEMVSYIQSATYRRVIDSISMSVDETTGKLTGTIAYNSYYLTGADGTFEPDAIPGNGEGVNSIFGTLLSE